jgi:hypothetical protein
MRRLLSLPPNAVSDYHRLHERNREDWFCTSDHYGTSREMISSTLALQNKVYDQPNPAIFTQNAVIDPPFTEEHRNIWIENAHIGKGWRLSADHVVTGVPENDWHIDLPEGVCIDMVPVDEKGYVVRPYGIDDMFKANGLMDRASLSRLYAQRAEFRQKNYPMLERNYGKSVFYQLDLSDMAADYFRLQLPVPLALSEKADRMQRIHNRMLRSRIFSLQGDKVKSETEEAEAFSLLRNGLIEAVADRKRTPGLAALPDQIVWGRSPVRIDLAGGWTDTPPFSLYAGGSVVNMAIELNGQPPLQVYVKPCKEFRFVLRSIDMGATEVVETYDELRDYRKLGSPFSIPRAALALCGFLPEFSGDQFDTLGEQLKAFGAGIEITLLAAIPAGSGLGTSSILAATVLGALNDFCGLQWSKQEIGTHTLVLEQLLTSGGGWQDHYGGILHGVKLLESERGLVQKPQTSWLPESLFTDPAYAACHLLYYTGCYRKLEIQ